MSGARLGARGLDHLKDNLSGRDLAIIGQVAELRLMSGKQIQRIHFTLDDHASPDTAARSARRVLERLVDERILHRLERRVGGVRAGSASFVYSLGPVGQRLLDLRAPRHRFAEPSTTFAVHTLAIVDTVVELTEAARHRQLELLTVQAEPRCWRMLPSMTGNGTVLRPDLFVAVGVGAFEHRWFIEIDLGSEHLPTLLRKCQAYETYYRSGIEQDTHGVFPRILWIMHTVGRARRLHQAIAASSRLTTELFTVTTTDQTMSTITQTGGDEPPVSSEVAS